MKIYVASSWRNDYQPDVVRALREVDHEVYDFRNPKEGDNGFQWREIHPNWQSWTTAEFRDALNHPIAVSGFKNDWAGMIWADACVLVLPCGRSAHIEAGYFVGAGKPLWILLTEDEPELMYKMATGLFDGLGPMLMAIQEHEDQFLRFTEGIVDPKRDLASADYTKEELN